MKGVCLLAIALLVGCVPPQPAATPTTSEGHGVGFFARSTEGWRNYDSTSAVPVADSTDCAARSAVLTAGMSAKDQASAFRRCMTERGWTHVRIYALDSAARCNPIELRTIARDSSAQPFVDSLRTILLRRYHPYDSSYSDDPDVRLLLTVSRQGIRAERAGEGYQSVSGATDAIGDAANELRSRLEELPAQGNLELAGRFRVRCVSERKVLDY